MQGKPLMSEVHATHAGIADTTTEAANLTAYMGATRGIRVSRLAPLCGCAGNYHTTRPGQLGHQKLLGFGCMKPSQGSHNSRRLSTQGTSFFPQSFSDNSTSSSEYHFSVLFALESSYIQTSSLACQNVCNLPPAERPRGP